jgi:hypothetical protein
MAFLRRMLGKMFSGGDKEESVTEAKFGNAGFRIGGLLAISPTFTLMLDDSSMFKDAHGDTDFSSMIISTILSFKFEGITIYRLYCDNPQCMVQVSEEANGSASYMLFMLTQEVNLDEELFNEWYGADGSIMNSPTVLDELRGEEVEFTKVFGPMTYDEQKEADGTAMERPAALSKAMSLFDHASGETTDYVLFDLEVENWYVEAFLGIDVPSEEVTVR